MDENYVIEVDDLKKAYKTRKAIVKAIRGISFKIKHGSITGILGPNGAGKTTLLKMIVGTILPDSGSLEVLGVSNPARHLNLLASKMGVVLEGSRNIYGSLTCAQNIKYFARLHGYRSSKMNEEIDSILDSFSILNKRDVPAMCLSRGMQQKLAICTALIHKPKLLLLDEPTLGLDVQSSIDLIKTLKKINKDLGVTILLTSHNLGIVQVLSTHLLLLKEGKIILNEGMRNALSLFDRKRFHLAVDSELKFEGMEHIKVIEAKRTNTFFKYTIEAENEERFLNFLFSLQERGVHFSVIYREKIKLEDVFFEVVKGGNKA